jgi:hypothetical protein
VGNSGTESTTDEPYGSAIILSPASMRPCRRRLGGGMNAAPPVP